MNELSFSSGLMVLCLGVIVGSFANVLIHRLPLMVLNEPRDIHTSTFDLTHPASHCPNCLTLLRAWHNIPVLSFLGLRGRCAFCKHPISWHYPAIELVTGLLWLACAWRWGVNANALCWAWFGTSLLALAVIDWQTSLLPDALTQTLLWAGLIASAAQWVVLPIEQSVFGSVAGYISLWSVAYVFERITDKEGMGAGDFKLLAALGAWLGPLALIPLVLLASSTGVVFGLVMRHKGQLHEGGYLPFGPFLAAAACLIALWGTEHVMHAVGW